MISPKFNDSNVFFFGFEILISWERELLEKFLAFSLKLHLSVGVFRKDLSILFKTIFGVFPPVTCWRVVVFYAFNKKRSVSSWW